MTFSITMMTLVCDKCHEIFKVSHSESLKTRFLMSNLKDCICVLTAQFPCYCTGPLILYLDQREGHRVAPYWPTNDTPSSILAFSEGLLSEYEPSPVLLSLAFGRWYGCWHKAWISQRQSLHGSDMRNTLRQGTHTAQVRQCFPLFALSLCMENRFSPGRQWSSRK